jgi:hypothetical protein
LLPTLVLSEFIITTGAHVLLANFAGPIITLVSPKLQEWKRAKNRGVSASETSKFECSIAEKANVRTHEFREMFMLHL